MAARVIAAETGRNNLRFMILGYNFVSRRECSHRFLPRQSQVSVKNLSPWGERIVKGM